MASDSNTTNSKRSKLLKEMSLVLVAVIIIIIRSYIRHFINYRHGLNQPSFSGIPGIWFLPIIILIMAFLAWILLFFLFVKRVVLFIKGLIMIVRLGIPYLILQLALTVLLFSILSILILTIPSKRVSLTRGFLERMKKEADVPAIQTWINTLDSDALSEFKKDEYGWWVDEAKWPDAIKRFSADEVAVLVLKSKNDKTYVRVLFGTALLGRWSLVVGVDSEEIQLNDYYESEHRLELALNAFVGYRIRD